MSVWPVFLSFQRLVPFAVFKPGHLESEAKPVPQKRPQSPPWTAPPPFINSSWTHLLVLPLQPLPPTQGERTRLHREPAVPPTHSQPPRPPSEKELRAEVSPGTPTTRGALEPPRDHELTQALCPRPHPSTPGEFHQPSPSTPAPPWRLTGFSKCPRAL